jgi:threonine/homoserine/homoserine lactone efflux protein
VTNPLTMILFVAALHAFANPSATPSMGVFLGSTSWWILLSAMVAMARSRLNANVLELSSLLASFVLLAMGAFTSLRIAERVFGRVWS